MACDRFELVKWLRRSCRRGNRIKSRPCQTLLAFLNVLLTLERLLDLVQHLLQVSYGLFSLLKLYWDVLGGFATTIADLANLVWREFLVKRNRFTVSPILRDEVENDHVGLTLPPSRSSCRPLPVYFCINLHGQHTWE